MFWFSLYVGIIVWGGLFLFNIFSFSSDIFTLGGCSGLAFVNWYGYYRCSKDAQENLGNFINKTQKKAVAYGTNMAMPVVNEQLQNQLNVRQGGNN